MTSELGVNGASGDGDRGKTDLVIVVVVVDKILFSNSSLPMSYKISNKCSKSKFCNSSNSQAKRRRKK